VTCAATRSSHRPLRTRSKQFCASPERTVRRRCSSIRPRTTSAPEPAPPVQCFRRQPRTCFVRSSTCVRRHSPRLPTDRTIPHRTNVGSTPNSTGTPPVGFSPGPACGRHHDPPVDRHRRVPRLVLGVPSRPVDPPTSERGWVESLSNGWTAGGGAIGQWAPPAPSVDRQCSRACTLVIGLLCRTRRVGGNLGTETHIPELLGI